MDEKVDPNAYVRKLGEAIKDHDVAYLAVIAFELLSGSYGEQATALGCVAMHHYWAAFDGQIDDADLTSYHYGVVAQALDGDEEAAETAETYSLNYLAVFGGVLGKFVVKRIKGSTESFRNGESLAAFLTELGVQLVDEQGRMSVYVNCLRGGAEVEFRAQIAIVKTSGNAWELFVMTAPYFWGLDWQTRPNPVSCKSMRAIGEFLTLTLTPRMDAQRRLVLN